MKNFLLGAWPSGDCLPVAGDAPIVRTLQEIYDKSLARTSFTLAMLAIAGAMALLIGLVGIYGVISYAVSQRQREIGISIAVGAQRSDVMRLVLSQGMSLILIGQGVGLAGSLASTRFLSSLLFGVTATDPLTFAGVIILLALVALAACYIPACRAVRVDPMVALRYALTTRRGLLPITRGSRAIQKISTGGECPFRSTPKRALKLSRSPVVFPYS